MKTTTKDLRTHTKRTLDAVERGQEVVITVCGKPRAKIVALQSRKRSQRVKGKAPLFGIWKDHPDSRNVSTYVDNLRSGRF
ncbi:MAG: type II toxin-antitoxin system prevent-host-death family antitoxin [Gammaproteobacteria bacterium]|nr:type II toxin-antitoxin system prevent-host-death family antitoxin [Gammaproteobacteria bacterium]